VAAAGQALSYLARPMGMPIPAEAVRQFDNSVVTPTERMLHGSRVRITAAKLAHQRRWEAAMMSPTIGQTLEKV
jgi:hypothetical protein